MLVVFGDLLECRSVALKICVVKGIEVKVRVMS